MSSLHYVTTMEILMPQKPAIESDRRSSNKAPATNEKAKEDRGGDLKHIIDTGLPPGIDVDDAKDPGSNTRRKQDEGRS
jgi:hypothetical protein